MPSIFICYPRELSAVRAAIVGALPARISAHGDWELQGGDPDYQRRLQSSVASSTAFVVLLDRNTVESDNCAMEMRWAIGDGKLLLPVQVDPTVDGKTLPPEIRGRQWILPAEPPALAAAITDAMGIDLQLFELNAEILPRALRWAEGPARASLLGGKVLTEAAAWLSRASADAALQPVPPDAVRLFVNASLSRRTAERALIVASLVALGSLGGWVTSAIVRTTHERDRRGDESLASNAQVAADAALLTPRALAMAIEAVRKPLVAKRAVPPLASRSLARAMLRTSGTEVLDGDGELTSAALSRDTRVLVEGTRRGDVLLREGAGWSVRRHLGASASPPTSVALSGSGARAIAGFADGAFTVWDATSGKTLLHEEGSKRVAFVLASVDGDTVLVGRSSLFMPVQPAFVPGWSADVEVWSVPHAQRMAALHRVNAAVLAAGGVAVGYADGSIEWKGRDMDPLLARNLSNAGAGRVDALLMPADRLELVALRDGKSAEWIYLPGGIPATSPPPTVIDPFGDLPSTGALDATGATLAVVNAHDHLHVVAHASGREIGDTELSASKIAKVAFLSGLGDDPVVLAAGSQGELSVASAVDGVWRSFSIAIAPQARAETPVLLLEDLGKGRAMVATKDDVRLITMESPTRLRESSALASWQGAPADPALSRRGLFVLKHDHDWEVIDAEARRQVLPREGELRASTFSDDGRFLATVDAQGAVVAYDCELGRETARIRLPEPPVEGDLKVRMSFDGRQVVVIGAGTSAWWDVRAARLVTDGLERLRQASYAGFASKSGTLLARAHGSVFLVDIDGTSPRARDVSTRGYVEALGFAPEAERGIAAGVDGGVSVMDPEGRTTFHATSWPAEVNIFTAALLAGANLVVVGGRNGAYHGPLVAFPMVDRGQPVALVPELDESVTSLAYFSDGGASEVAGCDQAEGVAVWETSGYEQVARLAPSGGKTLDAQIVFTPRGDVLFGDSDGTVRLLPGTPERLLDAADAMLVSTQDEPFPSPSVPLRSHARPPRHRRWRLRRQ